MTRFLTGTLLIVALGSVGCSGTIGKCATDADCETGYTCDVGSGLCLVPGSSSASTGSTASSTVSSSSASTTTSGSSTSAGSSSSSSSATASGSSSTSSSSTSASSASSSSGASSTATASSSSSSSSSSSASTAASGSGSSSGSSITSSSSSSSSGSSLCSSGGTLQQTQISPTDGTVGLGETLTYSLIYKCSNSGVAVAQGVIWDTGDQQIAIIGPVSGVLMPVGLGTTSVSVDFGGIQVSTNVTVVGQTCPSSFGDAGADFCSQFAAVSTCLEASCFGGDIELWKQGLNTPFPFCAQLDAAADAGRIVVASDPTDISNCLSALVVSSCLNLAIGLVPQDCLFDMEGLVPTGSPCALDQDCLQDGWCDISGLVCPGACQPRAMTNEACTQSSGCPRGEVCTGVCTAIATSQYGDLSATCDTGAAGTGNPCRPGLVCISANGQPATCTAPVPEGATCTQGANQCEPFNYCNTSNVCVRYGSLGSPCGIIQGTSVEDVGCLPGTRCDFNLGQCAPPGDYGWSCGTGSDCASGVCTELTHTCAATCSEPFIDGGVDYLPDGGPWLGHGGAVVWGAESLTAGTLSVDVHALAFDSANGRLFGTGTTLGGTFQAIVVELDPASGALVNFQLLGEQQSSGEALTVAPINGEQILIAGGAHNSPFALWVRWFTEDLQPVSSSPGGFQLMASGPSQISAVAVDTMGETWAVGTLSSSSGPTPIAFGFSQNFQILPDEDGGLPGGQVTTNGLGALVGVTAESTNGDLQVFTAGYGTAGPVGSPPNEYLFGTLGIGLNPVAEVGEANGGMASQLAGMTTLGNGFIAVAGSAPPQAFVLELDPDNPQLTGATQFNIPSEGAVLIPDLAQDVVADALGNLFVALNVDVQSGGVAANAGVVELFCDGGPGWFAPLPGAVSFTNGQVMTRDPQGYVYVATTTGVYKLFP